MRIRLKLSVKFGISFVFGSEISDQDWIRINKLRDLITTDICLLQMQIEISGVTRKLSELAHWKVRFLD